MNLQDQVSICVTSLNRVDALKLMWKSFVHHHGEGFHLKVYEQGSTDGAKEYAESIATEFIDGPTVPHGCALDEMVRRTETEYVLICDNDIEFLAPVLQRMLDECEFCVCAPRIYDMGSIELSGYRCYGQEGIDPSRALFKTKPLQKILEHFSFAGYDSRELGKHYDTGTMVHEVARVQDLPVATPDWIWGKNDGIWHWGAITWAMWGPMGDQNRIVADERYVEIQRRLATYG